MRSLLVVHDVRQMGLLSKLSPMSWPCCCWGRIHRVGDFPDPQLQQPYTSMIRVSPAPLEQAIVALDKP